MAKMKEVLTVVWGLILLNQAAAQHFCNETRVTNKTIEVEETATVWKKVENQECGTKGTHDILLNKEDIDGMTLCTFNRTTNVTRMVDKIIPEVTVVPKCCNGYAGGNCEQPICEGGCENSGRCIEPNQCNCDGTGYEGDSCEIAICSPECVHGECAGPKTCACTFGWEGSDCSTPTCTEKCQNNGTCISPGECSCPENWTGPRCEEANYECYTNCLNGGSCTQNGFCSCTEGYDGTHCENPICVEECLYGGKCIEPNKCMCPRGFSGDQCADIEENISLTPHVTYSERTFLDVGTLDDEQDADICTSQNRFHYNTFDGMHYYYPGGCTYNLAYQCDGEFHVQVNNSFDCQGKLCKRSVIIEVDGVDRIVMYPNNTLTHNDIFFIAPKTLSQAIKVQQIGEYNTVSLTGGLRVYFDNNMAVFVKVSKSYEGELCGLCGNNDNDRDNEFEVRGTPMENKYRYGDRMAVKLPGEECASTPYTPRHPCIGIDDSEVEQFKSRCEEMSSEAFSHCNDAVDPQPFIQRCIMDACSVGLDYYKESSCNSFSMYSHECALHSEVVTWRRRDFCNISCAGGKEHTECGSICEATCQNSVLSAQDQCDSRVCISGCFCPEGTVLNEKDDTCIPQQNCPCSYLEDWYQRGEIIQQDCNECQCMGGGWKCTKHECPRTCKVIGEDHYETFDGKSYQYSGGCEYVLVQTKEDVEDAFNVWVQNKGCGFEDINPCKKTLSLKFPGHEMIKLTGSNKVLVGNNAVALPYEDKNGVFKIAKSLSTFLRIDSKFGFELLWDQNHRIYIKAQTSLKSKLRGLCGNYNLNQQDDFTLSNGEPVVQSALFGNGWKTNTACSSSKGSSAIDTVDCAESDSDKKLAEQKCGVLKSGNFSQCNRVINPTDAISMCRHDVCREISKSGGNLDGVKCAVLSDYARTCIMTSNKLSSLSWRESAGCEITCDGGRVFKECVSSCEKTCRMIANDEDTCGEPSPCVEGCVCPTGTVFDEGKEKCVEESECTCFHGGVEYHAEAERQSFCEKCTCYGGKWECSPIPGCTEESLCSGGQEWSSCIECKRTCDNLNVHCEKLVCHEGCSCPEGQAFHEGKCIETAQCPCMHRNRSYPPGRRIRKDCNICTCTNTAWSCTTKKCPGICSAYGDPHYLTFDKLKYEFHGDCTYILAEDFCGSTIGSFRVLVENVPCSTGGLTCTKAVKITIHDTTIHLIRGSAPNEQKNPLALAGTPKADYRFINAGIFLIVKTKMGLTVRWDHGTRLYVVLEPNFMGKVCGLCGNFDGDATNDFNTRQGKLETRVTTFGDSWRLYSKCPPSESDPEHPCDVKPYRADWAQSSCAKVFKDPFDVCHHIVDPTQYYEDCVWDSCGCDKGGDCECLCTGMAAYVRDCNEHGSHIKWRHTNNCGLQCEKGMVYKECGSSCGNTCWKQYKEDTCDGCFEGCFCPEGFIMHNGKCIKQEECPCLLGGKEIPFGSTQNSACRNCTCLGGAWTCSADICATPPTPSTTSTTKPTTGKPSTTTPLSTEKTSTYESTTSVTGKTTPPTTPSCPANQEYGECAGPCHPTCHFNKPAIGECRNRTEECNFGCVCPGKKVLDDEGNCVEPSECDCKDLEGNRRKNGETWSRGSCEECYCFGNEVTCNTTVCSIVSCDTANGFMPATKTGDCCKSCVRTLKTTTVLPTSPTAVVTGTTKNTTVLTTMTTATICKSDKGEVYRPCRCVYQCGEEVDDSCEDEGDENKMCCVCEEGMVRDNSGMCIHKNKCTCYDEVTGESVSPGTQVQHSCEVCTCIGGFLKCEPHCSIDGCRDSQQLVYTEDGCCSCQEPTTTSIYESTTSTQETETTTPTCLCSNGTKNCRDCEKCISSFLVCDGTKQCRDGSDEEDCPCNYEGNILENGDIIPKSECKDCICEEGTITCKKVCDRVCEKGFYLQDYDDDDDRCCSCEKGSTTVPLVSTSVPELSPTSPEVQSTSTEATTSQSTPVTTTGQTTTTTLPVETTTAVVKTEVFTTTKTEIVTEKVCDSDLGMASGAISNRQIQLSSSSDGSGPSATRLSNEAETFSAWSPFLEDTDKYVEIDFDGETEITAITTQGGANGKFVKKLSLKVNNGKGWKPVTDPTTDNEETAVSKATILSANSDDVSIRKIKLPESILAKKLRIVVEEWADAGVALRFELHGCGYAVPTTPQVLTTSTEKTVKTTTPLVTETTTETAAPTSTTPGLVETTTVEVKTSSPITEEVSVSTTGGETEGTTVKTLPPTKTTKTVTTVTEETTTTSVVTTPPAEACHAKMTQDSTTALKSGISFTASTTREGSSPNFGRLNYVDSNNEPNAWKPSAHFNQYLQIRSEKPVVITAIQIQGDGVESYVKSFHVRYRLDGTEEWQDVMKDGAVAEFKGPSDASSVRQVELPTGIELNEIRLEPDVFKHHVAIRAELLGCHKEITHTTVKTTTTTGEITTTEKEVSSNASTTTPSGETRTTITEETVPTTVIVQTSTVVTPVETTTTPENTKAEVTETVETTPASPPVVTTTTTSEEVPTETTVIVPHKTTPETTPVIPQGICGDQTADLQKYIANVTSKQYDANVKEYIPTHYAEIPDLIKINGSWNIELWFSQPVFVTAVITQNKLSGETASSNYGMSGVNEDGVFGISDDSGIPDDSGFPLNDDHGNPSIHHLQSLKPMMSIGMWTYNPHGFDVVYLRLRGCPPKNVTTPVVTLTSKQPTSTTPVTAESAMPTTATEIISTTRTTEHHTTVIPKGSCENNTEINLRNYVNYVEAWYFDKNFKTLSGEEIPDPISFINLEATYMYFSEPVFITAIIAQLKIPGEAASSSPLVDYGTEDGLSHAVHLFPRNDQQGYTFENHKAISVPANYIKFALSNPENYLEVELSGCLTRNVVTTPVTVVTSKQTTTTSKTPVTEETTGFVTTPSITQSSKPERSTSMRSTASHTQESTTLRPLPTKPTTVEIVTTETTTETATSPGVTSMKPHVEITNSTTTRTVITTETEEAPSSSTSGTVTSAPPKLCAEPMGVEYGVKSDLRPILTASSNDKMANEGRLNNTDSWRPEKMVNGENDEWLQVTFDRLVNVSSVMMQGDEASGNHVTLFLVSYEDAEKNWHEVHKYYTGNNDGTTVVEIPFEHTLHDILAIKIKPVESMGGVALRVELRGCYKMVISTTTTQTSTTVAITEATKPSTAETTTSPTSEAVTTRIILPTTSEIITTVSPKSTAGTTSGKITLQTTKETISHQPTAISTTTVAMTTGKPLTSTVSTAAVTGEETTGIPGTTQPKTEETPVVETTTTKTETKYTTQKICDEEMGMRSHQIPDENIKASTFQNGSEALKARNLDLGTSDDTKLTAGAWSPLESDGDPYLQVTFPTRVTITAIVSQGDGIDGFVAAYYVSSISEGHESDKELYSANTDASAIAIVNLFTPMTTKVIRIYPQRRENKRIALRVEFRGCEKMATVPATVQTTTVTTVKKSTEMTPHMTTMLPTISQRTGESTEVVETTTTVTEATTPVMEQPTTTKVVVTTTRKVVETTSEEITETTSQSRVVTTEQPIAPTQAPSQQPSTASTRVSTSTPSVETTQPNTEICDKVMELKGKAYKEVTATYGASSNPSLVKSAILDQQRDGVWYPIENTTVGPYGDYVEVDFSDDVFITTIKTQGDKKSSFVNLYRVYAYSVRGEEDSPAWHRVDQVFKGNTNPFDISVNNFSTPLKASALKISVVDSVGKVALRFSVSGCFKYTAALTAETSTPVSQSTTTRIHPSSEATEPATTHMLVSTTYAESKPVVSTRITTKSTENTPTPTSSEHVTSSVQATESTGATEATTTTTVSVKTVKPEMTSAVSTATQQPLVETSTSTQAEEITSTEAVLTGKTTEKGVTTSERPPVTTTTQVPVETTSIVETTTAKVVTVETTTKKLCDGNMGAQIVDLDDATITTITDKDGSSSQYVKNMNVSLPAWSPQDYDDEPAVFVHLPKQIYLTSIVTRGSGNGEYPGNYLLQYKKATELEEWSDYGKDEEGRYASKVFDGGHEGQELTENVLDEPIVVRAIALRFIFNEDKRIAVRLELKSCKALATVPVTVETTTETVTTTVSPTAHTETSIATTTSPVTTSLPGQTSTTPKETSPTVVTQTITVTTKTTPVEEFSTSATSSIIVSTTNIVKSTSGEFTKTTITKKTEETTSKPITASTTTTSTPGVTESTAPIQTSSTPAATEVSSTSPTTVVKTVTTVSGPVVITSGEETTTPKRPLVTEAPKSLCDGVMELNGSMANIAEPEISASSNAPTAKLSGLDSKSYWKPDTARDDAKYGSYVEAKFEKPVYVTGVTTQGDGINEYVKSINIYILPKSENEHTPEWRLLKKFDIPDDMDAVKKFESEFPNATEVEGIRISPVDHTGDLPAMRFGIEGCFRISTPITTTKATPTTTTSVPTSTTASTQFSTTAAVGTSMAMSSTKKPGVTTKVTVTPESHTTQETTVQTSSTIIPIESETGQSTPAVVESTTETTVTRTIPVSEHTPEGTTSVVSTVTKETVSTTPIGYEETTTGAPAKTTKVTITEVVQSTETKTAENPLSTESTVSKEVTTTTSQEITVTTEKPFVTESSSPATEVTTTTKSSPVTIETVTTTEVPSSESAASTTPEVLTSKSVLRTSQPKPPVVTTTAIVPTTTKGRTTTTLAESESTTEKVEITSTSAPTEVTSTTSTETGPVQVSTKVVTTTKTEVSTQSGVCDEPMGMGSNDIPEEDIDASSSKNGREATFARITKGNDDSSILPSWSPEDNDENSTLKVSFPKTVSIRSILTQGGGNGNYVKQYTLKYLDADSGHFLPILNDNRQPKVFTANTDDRTIVSNSVNINTTAIVIEPVDWTHGNFALRVELRGCVKYVAPTTPYLINTTKEVTTTTSTPVATEKSTSKPGETSVSVSVTKTTTSEVKTSAPVETTVTKESKQPTSPTYKTSTTTEVVATTVTSTEVTKRPAICNKTMEDTSEVIVSKPVYHVSSNPDLAELARLNASNWNSSWYADASDNDPFIQVDFNDTVYVTSLATHGIVNNDGTQEYVSSFTVQYYNTESEEWETIKDGEDDKTFTANSDGQTLITQEFEEPFRTKAVRLRLTNWIGTLPHLCVDVGGCFRVSYQEITIASSTVSVTTVETPITETKLSASTTESPETTSAVVVSSTTRVYPTTKTTSTGISSTKPTISPETTAITTTKEYVKPSEQPVETTSLPSFTTTSGATTSPASHSTMTEAFTKATTIPEKTVSLTTTSKPESTSKPAGSTTSPKVTSKSTTIFPKVTTVQVISTEKTVPPEVSTTQQKTTTGAQCRDCDGLCDPGQSMARHSDECCYCTYTPETTSSITTVIITSSPTTQRSCSEPFVFHQCAPQCTQYCPSIATGCKDHTITCTGHCDCPDGTLFNGLECVPVGDCPCSVDNTVYEAREEWENPDDECSTCVCVNGERHCSESDCVTPTCLEGEELKTLDGKCCPECVTTPTVPPVCDDKCYCVYGCDRDGSSCPMLNDCPSECTCNSTAYVKMSHRCAYFVPTEQCLPTPTSGPYEEENGTTAATPVTTSTPPPVCPDKCNCTLGCKDNDDCTKELDCEVDECTCSDPTADRKNGRCARQGPCERVTPTVTPINPCGDEKTWEDCACAKTCSNMADPNFKCPSHSSCVPDCVCPDGMVEHHDKCINSTDCPCYDNGKYYKFAETRQEGECEDCTCTEEGMVCGKVCRISAEECNGEIKQFNHGCCQCFAAPTTTATSTVSNATTVVFETASPTASRSTPGGTTGTGTPSNKLQSTTTPVGVSTTSEYWTSTSFRPTTMNPLITTPQIICTPPLIPLLCGCNVTCDDRNAADCDQNNCNSGCYCPSGTVMDGGKCIKADQCPCWQDGKRMPSGGNWKRPICEKCSCESGKISCDKGCDVTCDNEREILIRNYSNPDQCCYCQSRNVPLPTTHTVTQTSTETTSGVATTQSSPVTTPQVCQGCLVDDRCRPVGEKWVVDSCTNGTCLDTGVTFDHKVCSKLSCKEGSYEAYKEGSCCPHCEYRCLDEFYCPHPDSISDCIPQSWLCDGENDCYNKEDEAEWNCPTTTSPAVTGHSTSSSTKPPVTSTNVSTTTGSPCQLPFVLADCPCTCADECNCVRGCGCPDGTYESDGECIEEQDCPCYEPLDKHLYKGGDRWFPNNCTECKCLRETNKRSCGDHCSGTCPDDFDMITKPDIEEGDCCVCRPKINCHHNGTYRKVGEVWHENKCKTCKCVEENGETEVDCYIWKCPTCGADEIPVDVEGECCVKCIKATTVLSTGSTVTTVSTSVPIENTTASCDGIICDDNICIPRPKVCDDTYDCLDGADEEECETPAPPPPPETTTIQTTTVCGGFDCGNNDCQPSHVKCNGSVECANGRDEAECGPTTATTVTTAVTSTAKVPTTSGVSTTPETKILCPSKCLCVAACNGSTDACSPISECSPRCKCPDPNIEYERIGWRCIMSAPASACTTTTALVPTASTAIGETPTVPVPTLTTARPSCSRCICNRSCEDEAMGTIPQTCKVNDFCSSCNCPDGTFRPEGTNLCLYDKKNECSCVVNNTVHQNGSSYWKGDCQECICISGKERCFSNKCRLTEQECEDLGKMLRKVDGECCQCVEKPTPTTTSILSTISSIFSTSPTTTAPTTATTISVCGLNCIRVMTCTEQNEFGPERMGIFGYAPPECNDCTCPSGTELDYADSYYCLKYPPSCPGCIHEGEKYEVGHKYSVGDCTECVCEPTNNGSVASRCYTRCNIRATECEKTGRILVDEPDVCCECKSISPPTTPATTMSTTSPNIRVCDPACIVHLTCEDAREAYLTYSLPVFPLMDNCDECGCPDQSYRHEIDDTMCVQEPPDCTEPCFANGVQYYGGDEFTRGECQRCTCVPVGHNYEEDCHYDCLLSDEECLSKGKVLITGDNMCCYCGIPPTTVPTMVPTTVETTAATTTEKPDCELECICMLGCDYDQSHCTLKPGCSSNCDCPPMATRINGRCAMDPDEDDCATTTSSVITSTATPRATTLPTTPASTETFVETATSTTSRPGSSPTPEQTSTTVETTIVISTPEVPEICDWDCRCYVKCDERNVLQEGQVPPRCAEARAECDLCACPDGYVRDQETRKCIQSQENCSCDTRKHQETYWKGDCQKCNCIDGVEKCVSGLCRITEQDCASNERFMNATGTCCSCAPYIITTTRVLTTPVPTTPVPTSSKETTKPVAECSPTTVLHKLEKSGCISQTDIEMSVCQGSCSGSYRHVTQYPFVQNDCGCCQPTYYEMKTATLDCGNGTTIDVQWPKPTECSCEDCRYEPFAEEYELR